MDTYRNILLDKTPSQMLFNIDGTAGCGKTYLIAAICQGLRQLADFHDRPDPIRVLASSGVAALNVHGQTLHSGFHLPVNGFSLLSGSRLATMQLLWQGVYFVIIDEKSMLGQRTLAQIDSRCRQLFPQHANVPFGKLNIALVGDFAQLPPVGDTPLYSPPSSVASENGCLGRDGSSLYRLFTRSFLLQIVHRQAGDSPEQVKFRTLLQHASQGSLTREEWELLNSRFEKNLCPEDRILFQDCTCLYTTRTDVNEHNLAELRALNQPCARITARHDGGPAAAKATADEAGGLENHILLGKGAKVMITRNIWQTGGLVNGTTGVIEDIIWPAGSPQSDLPLAVLVSCKTYGGPTMWHTEPRSDFPNGVPIVPITPLKTTFEIDGKIMSRTQFPLRLAWAVTVHKSQGLTLGRIKLGLGKREFATGLTFVALSRVKTLDCLMIVDPLHYSRVHKLGGKHLKYRLDDYEHRHGL